MNILIIGASGMVGSAALRVLSEQRDWMVFGTVRDVRISSFFPTDIAARLIANVDATNPDDLVRALERVRPDVVVNCVGLTKHKMEAEAPLTVLPLNALMTHRLAGLCKLTGARLIHVSTDCVFSGNKGNYREDDRADADDLYGRSKILGEVCHPHTVTLRTSTIGHELQSKYGLLEWFLSQQGSCQGYTRAIFSGLPTVIFAQVIRDVVIPHQELAGLYHVAAQPIQKYELLKLIAKVYGKEIEIIPDASLAIDRSLNAERFHEATGYEAPPWPRLIELMHSYK